MKPILLLFILFLSGKCLAQEIISGIIQDSSGKGIIGASVMIYNKGETTIVAYALTSPKGEFEINISNVKSDSIMFKVSHISYKSFKVVVANETHQYVFTLQSKSNTLPDVITRNYRSPVTQTKDSINYNVATFKAKQDRVIGDIIKKMPGIEMNGDQILYNGKPLKRYYINGIDLMQGRYGIINNSLPADAVKKIQLIENDQPIKLLDSLLPSHQASINLVTKRFSTSGSGGVGIGASPLLWDAGLTPINIFKKWQMLNSFQTNNTGNDVSEQLNVLTSDSDPGDTATKRIIGVHTATTPPFDKTKWLYNNIKMYNSSFVLKSHENLDINGSISYINDFQKREEYNRSNIITPDKNITVTEQTRNRFNTNDLRGSFSIIKNESNIHLTEKFNAGKEWHYNNAINLRNDTSDINELADYQSSYLSNELNIITKWGKQLINISSTTTYGVSPQKLTVTPGQFTGILNDTIPYDNAVQNIQYKKFSTNNSIGFTKTMLGLNFNFNTGLGFQSERLQSILNIDGKTKGDLFVNNVRYLHPRFYFNTNLLYQRDKLNVSFKLPVSWETFRADYNLQPSDSTIHSAVLVNPELYFELPVGNKWQLSFSNNYSEDYGSQSDTYLSYILSSYDRLGHSNTLRVPHSKTISSAFSADYKNLLTTRFGGVMVLFSKSHNDFIAQTYLDSLGLSYLDIVSMNNSSSTVNIIGHISQFFSSIKSTVKLSASWNHSVSDQLINNVFSPLTANSYSGNIQVNSSILKWLSLDYVGAFQFSQTFYPDRKLNNIASQRHHLEMNTFPFDRHMLSIFTDYYENNLKNSHNQVFLNLKYTFTLPKSKTDFAISWNNILNVKKFITQYNTAYSFVYSERYLRPSQILFSVRFYF